jgi:hypothetical protein
VGGNIKLGFKGKECKAVDWIHVTQDRVNMVMNIKK